MSKKYLITLTSGFIFLTFASFLIVQTGNTQTAPAGSIALTEVEPKYVCMVTNKLFPKEQIPVEVSNKTYYGCCEMCKAQLANNQDKREAVDPVSGKKVDKADSVIGATSSGNVYYFESKENLSKFTN